MEKVVRYSNAKDHVRTFHLTPVQNACGCWISQVREEGSDRIRRVAVVPRGGLPRSREGAILSGLEYIDMDMEAEGFVRQVDGGREQRT